jgi:hypothetical protein
MMVSRPWLVPLVVLLTSCGAQQQANQTEQAAVSPGQAAGGHGSDQQGADLSQPLSDCPVSPTPLSQGGPLRLTAEQSQERWGQNVSRLDQVATSRQVPIEVCGVAGQMRWLLNVTCPNGTAPFATADDAHRARVGNAGRGGRCGAIIDLYRVSCSDETYDIFLDLYHCGPSEEFPQG